MCVHGKNKTIAQNAGAVEVLSVGTADARVGAGAACVGEPALICQAIRLISEEQAAEKAKEQAPERQARKRGERSGKRGERSGERGEKRRGSAQRAKVLLEISRFI